jgi:hypothetical protein
MRPVRYVCTVRARRDDGSFELLADALPDTLPRVFVLPSHLCPNAVIGLRLVLQVLQRPDGTIRGEVHPLPERIGGQNWGWPKRPRPAR